MTPEKRIRIRLSQRLGTMDWSIDPMVAAEILKEEVNWEKDLGQLPEMPVVDGSFHYSLHYYGGYPQIVLPGSKLKLPTPPPRIPLWRRFLSSPESMLALVWATAFISGFCFGRWR